jgi:tyrosine-protein phosphatase YwqE
MARKKAQGLGDTIDQITTATGIKALVKFVAGDDCNCDQRKEALNKLFRYSKPNCLSEADYNFLKEFFEVTRGSVVPTVQYRLNQIYTSTFNKNAEFTNCGSCLLDRISELKKVFNSYVEDNQ